MPTGDLVTGSDGHLALAIGPWAREKLFYIQRYCDIFNSGMKDIWRVRTFIDLLAGTGRCRIEETGEEVDGSALIALQCKVPFTHYFFNDSNPEAIDSLDSRVASFASTRIRLFHKDCNEVIEDLRSELPSHSLDFCFIDPLNWEIKFESIRELTKDRRMDLAITFHTGNMKRVVHDPPGELDEFFGDRLWHDEYRSAVLTGKRTKSRILLDAYERRLGSLGYVDVRDWLPVRNTRSVTLYHLIFASKHRRGRDFWDKISQRSFTGQLRMI
jgi:three-Cys-motif partner protein